MNNTQFTRKYIEQRGGVKELAEEEKSALLTLNEGITRSSQQMKLRSSLEKILKKSLGSLKNLMKGMEPKEVGEVLLEVVYED